MPPSEMSGPGDGPVAVLTIEQCWSLLATERLGRLIVSVGDQIDVFPVNYLADSNRILFRTAEGTKLAELTIHSSVVFEVDHIGDTAGWSVVVHGTARTLSTSAEVAAAEQLDLQSWIPTTKNNIVEISPTGITGRHLRFGNGSHS